MFQNIFGKGTRLLELLFCCITVTYQQLTSLPLERFLLGQRPGLGYLGIPNALQRGWFRIGA